MSYLQFKKINKRLYVYRQTCHRIAPRSQISNPVKSTVEYLGVYHDGEFKPNSNKTFNDKEIDEIDFLIKRKLNQ